MLYRRFRRINYRLAVQRRRHWRRLRILGKHPLAFPVGVFVLLVMATIGSLWWFTSRGASLTPAATDLVIISFDHQTETVPSHEATVGALLSKLHISVNKGDVVEPALTTAIHQDDFRINIYRAAPVKVVDGTMATYTYSAATTPRSVAQQAGLTIYPEDAITTAPATNFLAQGSIGSVVTIDRSVPVTLDVNGFAAGTRTRATTVAAFLAEKHIAIDHDTTITPAPETPITPDEQIAVTRDGTGIQSVTQDIPMPVQYINDGSLAYGTSAVRQTGSDGQQVLTYRIEVLGGKVVNQVLLQTVVTVEPVTQIVAQGTSLSGIKGDMALAGIAPGNYQYADYIISNESGWCPTKWQGEVGYCPVYHGAPTSAYVGYGLCQATPGYKMQTAGADWATNPITQLEWCSGYAQSRYGGWYNAYVHWMNYHNW